MAKSILDLFPTVTALVEVRVLIKVLRDEVGEMRKEISQLRELVMALDASVVAKIAEIKKVIVDGVTGVRADIEALKKLVSGGGTVEEILAGLDELSTAAKSIADLDAENPATPGNGDQV